MKNSKKIIHIIRIIAIIALLIFILLLSLSYTITQNNNYKDSLINNIKSNYPTNDDITYANLYGNYYIFTTKDKVFVLNNEYKEVYKEDIKNIAKNTSNYELIYKTNKLIYENTTCTKNSVTYEYYDAKTYKKISTTTLEK